MAVDPPSGPPRPGAISLNIKEKSILYAAYMPFVKGGGIFIPTARSYKLGDEIFMPASARSGRSRPRQPPESPRGRMVAVSAHVDWQKPKALNTG